MAKQKISPFDSLGYTGLKRYGGTINEEFHPKLRGSLAVQVYREMRDNDPIVGAILYAIENLIRQAEWKVESADQEDKAALEASEFVEGCLQDMSHTFEDLLAEILSMLTYGWAYFEIVYKRREGLEAKDAETRSKYDDGKIGWRKISIRKQDSLVKWQIDDDGGIRGFWQAVYPSYVPTMIPIEKSLLFRTTAHANNPEGRSILRNAYRPWFFKKNLEEVEAIGIERDLAGLPVLEVPIDLLSPTAGNDERALLDQFKVMVRQIKRDEREGIIIPSETDDDGKPTGYRLKLLSASGRHNADVGNAIVRYEQRIAVSVLAEFMMLGLDKVGSYALASTKTSLFSTALRSLMDTIAAVFNRYAIPRLMELNGIEEELWPKMTHGDAGSPDLAEIGAFIRDMTAAGLIEPDTELKKKIRLLGHLPEPPEEEEALEAMPFNEEEMLAALQQSGVQQPLPPEGTPAKPGATPPEETEETEEA